MGGPEQVQKIDRDEQRSFFISYAHADAGYVKRLAAHLSAHQLPVWFDENLRWGSRFPYEIQRRIAAALGVIVVMSPAAEKSEWVEREILEGQRHDRIILPVLRAGERLFLLASTHFVDARGDAMPGAAEIRRLRDIHAAEGTLPPQVPFAPPIPPVRTVPTLGRTAPAAAPDDKLRPFLDEGQLVHADILTTSLLLAATGRLDNGWIRQADAVRIPFALFDDIDAAWAGHGHGFRVQLSRHRGNRSDIPAGGARDFSALAQALGWRDSEHDLMPRYGEFVQRSAYPGGFFPTLRNPQREQHQGWSDSWRQTVVAVHLMLRKWGGWHG